MLLFSRDEWISCDFKEMMDGQQAPYNDFDKEDMTDMFSRAMFEKMQLVGKIGMKVQYKISSFVFSDPPRAKYNCFVCSKLIQGRVCTAMGNKFHPECFVCTYCRGQFKERKYKTNPRDRKPYCLDCFDKLLGHFGNIHSTHG